jgi:hypothetical protein
MRRASLFLIAVLAVAAPSSAKAPWRPITQDPLGPISDVTQRWQDFQPAAAFCIKPENFELTGDQGATATGSDPACAFSGFPPSARGLYKVDLGAAVGRPTPPLCNGCRRIFIAFSKIRANAPPLYYYAHGHAYFRFDSRNPYYVADPYAHSPNMKNFLNDKLLVPNDPSDPRYPFVFGFDLHGMEYVSDTAHFVHATAQGPWYAGPWYVNTAGKRINGVYLDIDVSSCPARSCSLHRALLDDIWYRAGYSDGANMCGRDPITHSYTYTDGNYLYGGCFNAFGFSSRGVDPFR